MRLKGEKEKILIIVNDVWAKIDLKMIGIPIEHCKVFLTTRRKQVCINMGCQQWIPLEALTKEEGLLLLKRRAGLKDDFPTLNKLAEEVANECKGLSLAIVTVGSALREKSADEWKTMIQKLKKSKLVKLDNVDIEVYAIIKWSYDYLKSKEAKLCFLLCSLFPEDHEIDVEVLFRYGYGLGWYEDSNSIEEARAELQVMVNNLKTSSLLLDVDKGFVKMHDIVRDVALWIASEDEYGFMVKAGLGLTEWPKHQGLDQCKAISLIKNDINVLPDDLVCPNLLIMLLGYKYAIRKVGDKFFQGMKNLRVLTLMKAKLSLRSLESLTCLVTLQMVRCELQDALSLKGLASLEIFSLYGCFKNDGYLEVKEINRFKRLKIMDLRSSSIILEKIPTGVISELSGLEELYIVSNPSIEGNATLSELNQLPCLTTLSLRVKTYRDWLPNKLNVMENLNLQKYEVSLEHISLMWERMYRRKLRWESTPAWWETERWTRYLDSRKLSFSFIDGDSLCVLRSLYKNVDNLEVKDIHGCPHNIIPCIDQMGLIELKSLCLSHIKEGLECIIDVTEEHAPFTALSHLVDLCIDSVDDLRELCKGGNPPQGFLEKLETMKIVWCNSITNCLFPNSSLQSLTTFEVYRCPNLRYIFTLNVARSLLHLKRIEISHCGELEYIFGPKDEGDGDKSSKFELTLPKLEILFLGGLKSILHCCPYDYHFIFPALMKLTVEDCPKMITTFSVDGNGSVHCQAQAQASPSKVDMEHSSPSTTGSILCESTSQIRERLPPYIGR